LEMGGRIEVEDARLALADDRPLIERWQPAVVPEIDAANGERGVSERDERRKIARLRAEAVTNPAAERGMPSHQPAAVQRINRLPVVVDARRHRIDDGNLINNLAQVRQQFGEPDPGLPVLLEFPGRGKDLLGRAIYCVLLKLAGEFLVDIVDHLRL